MIRSMLVASTLAALLPAAAVATSEERVLHKETVVRAPLAAVWHAWTTEDGLRFVSDASNVDLTVGGPYELFLDGPADDAGRRGAEGSRVVAFVPGELLAFTWTFPPAVPTLRAAGATTVVVVRLDSKGATHTRVRLDAVGWRDGADWDAGYTYFDAAWGHVLDLLREHLESRSSVTVEPSNGGR